MLTERERLELMTAIVMYLKLHGYADEEKTYKLAYLAIMAIYENEAETSK